MEFFRTLDCESYSLPDPESPALNITVREELFGRQRCLKVPVDTGFAGYLLVPSDIYASLAMMELPREEFGTYSTMTGPIILRRAEVKLAVGKRELDSFIESPLHGTGKALLGRRVLCELDLALFGTKRRCCRLESASRR